MTNKQAFKQHKLTLRKHRVRSRITGSQERPRLTVARSTGQIYAQLVDDLSGNTLASASSLTIKSKASKVEAATEVGKAIAKAALDKGVSAVIFDRSGYKYHGRVKALAEGAREAGLKF